MIRAMLFDLDENLIDRTETMRRFLLSQHQRFPALQGHAEKEFIDGCLHHQKNGYADKIEAYTSVCVDLGCAGGTLADQLFEDFKEQYGKNPVLFPGVIDTLSTLHQRYRMGLVSNGRTRGQTAKIDASGLAGFFSSVCISEAVGCKKPDHAIFMKCLDELSVSPAEAVFVGDNPLADIEPAKSLGMRAIWLKNKYFPEPALCDGVISDIRELIGLLEDVA